MSNELDPLVERQTISSKLLLVLFFLLSLDNQSVYARKAQPTNEPWISHYFGTVSAETEMAILDNFVVQIMNDSDLIGYILIYSGEDSCRDEAQARALRMKKYMTNVRGVPWNRVMWKHGGRFKGKGLEIFHLGVERKGLASFDFPY